VLEIVFVLAAAQNKFFVEQAEAIVYELERAGVKASISTDGFPPVHRDLIYVLFPPHEYFVLEGEKQRIDERLLSRSIFLSAEQPGTVHFKDNIALAQHAGAVMDINESGVREYARNDIRAAHLPLGYSSHFDHYSTNLSRDIDVLFMGCHTARRARLLSGCSAELARWRSRLIISDNSHPNTGSSASFLAGEDKFSLLKRASVIVNIHQSDEPYFEWARVLDAIHSGCVVVTEHSVDYAPLVPGRHFVSTRPEVLGAMIGRVMADSSLRSELSASAYDVIRSKLPLAASAALLAEVARDLARSLTLPAARHDHSEAVPDIDITVGFATSPGTLEDPITPATPYSGVAPESAALRRILKEVRLDMMDLRRQTTRTLLTAERGRAVGTVRRRLTTLAYELRSAPRVTVVTAVYNHGEEISLALDSLAGSEFADWEVVVVDDGSTDGSGDRVADWANCHPEIALALISHPVNRGLPVARNVGLDFARGEYVFVLDADNAVYPNCLGDLAAALDRDPSSSFAYGPIATYDRSGPAGLVSFFPWEPERLRYGNYIDAMAMFRVSAVRALGGYSSDRRIYGWEDYDLYCRLAEHAYSGAFVDRIVGRYRVSATSMISFSNISHTTAFVALKEHAPMLMSNVTPPE
jgi:hypothetical protein